MTTENAETVEETLAAEIAKMSARNSDVPPATLDDIDEQRVLDLIEEAAATDYGTLTDCRTGDAIRPATRDEWVASYEAAQEPIGGGTGAIKVDGVSVWVDGGPCPSVYDGPEGSGGTAWVRVPALDDLDKLAAWALVEVLEAGEYEAGDTVIVSVWDETRVVVVTS